MFRLQPPRPVLEIAEKLESAGFEAWCVGGAIRDVLLGHPHLDWDLATSAKPAQVRELFGAKRTIPVGIDFGTVGVLDRHGKMHEVTTFRRDVDTDGRHAIVEFGVSLDDDLARRDFTINAIAFSPKTGELRDPFGGQQDIARKLVRAVGDADARMREDRLRALRAIRFAARFDFEIEPATLRAIQASAPYLGRLSPERVKQELDKTLEQVRCPSTAFRVWKSSGAFRSLVPTLAELSDEALAAADHVAIPGTLARPARRAIRFAAVFSSLPARQAEAALVRLRASKHETQAVSGLVNGWHTLGPTIDAALCDSTPVTDAQVRRWVAEIGRLRVGGFMRLANALWAVDRLAGRTAPTTSATRALYRRMLWSAFNEAIDLGSLAIDGDDLRRIGISPGPDLGKILHLLLAEVLEDPAKNTTDWLLQEAHRFAGGASGASDETRG
ncbi:MAG: CCA tRNA nucleotidyltransferase [Gemmatimonadaceae bacterium]